MSGGGGGGGDFEYERERSGGCWGSVGLSETNWAKQVDLHKKERRNAGSLKGQRVK